MESSNFTYNSKPLKKTSSILSSILSSNCGTYPIRQLSSLKLPTDSQCIQATSSKGIFVPNIRREFLIYTSRQSATLTQAKCHFDKNVEMIFCVAMWIWMSPLTYWNWNSSSKILVLQWLFVFISVYSSQKVKWYTFPKMFV